MARTDLTKTEAPGSYGGSGQAVTMVAADVANQNAFVAQGADLIVVHNTDSGAHAVTVTSAPDPFGRNDDISSESIAAGEIRVFGPFKTTGWIQSDGKIYLEADDATVELGVVKLPG